MTSVWDRRKPRITYQVPVGVHDLAQERLLTVSSINVSSGGMFVDTSESLAIGTELVCNLPVGIGNEAICVKGRVAWLRDNPNDSQRPVGMGIEFVDLSEEETGQLSEIVGDKQETSYPVRMKLSGMGAPVRACAKLTDQGIFIRTPLPFLTQDSQVDFSFVDDEEQSHRGRIVGVEVQHDDFSDVPRLQVEIELDSIGHDELVVPEPVLAEEPMSEPAMLETMEQSPVEGPHYIEVEDTLRTESVFGDELAEGERERELESEEDWPAPVVKTDIGGESDKYDEEDWMNSSPDDSHSDVEDSALWQENEYSDSHSRSERRSLWPIAAAVCFVVVGALAIGLHRGDDDAKAAKNPVAGQRQEVLALIEGADFEPVEAIGNEVESEMDTAEHPVELPDPMPQEAPSDIQGNEPVDSPVEEKKTQAPRSKHSTETVHGLKIVQGEELVFRLPLKGSDERFESYALANPAGIAVNLPYAQPKAGFVNSVSPKHPQVRRAWIRERLGGLHFRLFFVDDSQVCKASVNKKILTIRCSNAE